MNKLHKIKSIKTMKKKIIKLNEKDIERLVNRIIKEDSRSHEYRRHKVGGVEKRAGEGPEGHYKDYMDEDSEGEETYNYGRDLHHDSEELHDLEHRHGSRRHIRNLKKDMGYDEKRGVGKDDKWRRERGTHFDR